MNRIRVEQVGKKIRVAPYDRVNEFDRYLGAVKSAGGRFNSVLKVQEVPEAMLAQLLASLRGAGFEVMLQGGLAEKATKIVEARKADVSAATDRFEERDAELKTRGLQLYPYQRDGVRWLSAQMGAVLGDACGLGKTAQALLAIPAGVPVVVVCPAVAKGVWVRETAKWRPDLTPVKLSGKGSFRAPKPGEIVITNYDILPDLPTPAQSAVPAYGDQPAVEAIPAGPDPLAGILEGTVLVADEAHVLGGRKTQRGTRFRALRKAVSEGNGRVYGLTATPMLGSPFQLWGVFDSLGLSGQTFGGWQSFLAMFGAYTDRWGGTQFGTPDRARVTTALHRTMLRRLREDVLKDLPLKQYTEIDVELDTKTVKALDKLMTDLEVTPESLDAAVRGSRAILFEKIARMRLLVSVSKLKAATEIVESFEAQEEPLVVFTTSVAAAQELGRREGWGCITGETAPSERTRLETAFQAGELKGLAGTIQAMGVAITLTRAANALFVDWEWTPALNDQAEDRIARIGQERSCQIMRLVADHALERRILAIVTSKRDMLNASVEAAATVTLTREHDGLGVLQ